jgi:signal peptidase II
VKSKSTYISIGLVLLVLLIDQSLKIWVKTTMTYNQEILIFGLDWFKLHFTENPGMAFGMELGGDYGKLALSVFRIVAVGFMVYYIRLLIKQGAHVGLVASISLILAGAVGNILDSAIYGLIFSESHYHEVATMFPEGGGYAKFLHGKVVDMLYFPMYEGNLFGLLGERNFQFFRPVFNIADSAITLGVFIILAFQKRFFTDTNEVDDTSNDTENTKETIAENNTSTQEGSAVEFDGSSYDD